ncbi:MAG: RsmF rRNA methyltransferase first C-terminal domain-containing protein [Thomasclavelia ramosa]
MPQFPASKGDKVLRNGLYLENVKRAFEPSHSLALL